MVIGLGTGSTTYFAIKKIGELVRNNLNLAVVPTSKETAKLVLEEGIPLVELSDVEKLDLTIDGADEVDRNFNLTKGGGAALLREKIVASASEKLIIIVDESKIVSYLGDFPLPVEINTFSWKYTKKMIENLGCTSSLRRNKKDVYITDNNNYIIDCNFNKVENPKELNINLNQIPGVVENGIFANMADIIIVGYNNESLKIFKQKSPAQLGF